MAPYKSIISLISLASLHVQSEDTFFFFFFFYEKLESCYSYYPKKCKCRECLRFFFSLFSLTKRIEQNQRMPPESRKSELPELDDM